ASIHYFLCIGSEAIIFNLEKNHRIKALYGQYNGSSLILWSDPILDGILHERLKNHRRDAHAKAGKIDLLNELKTIAKPDLLYANIVVDEVELLNQAHHLVTVGIQGIAKNV